MIGFRSNGNGNSETELKLSVLNTARHRASFVPLAALARTGNAYAVFT